jgi:predicted RNase H-like nuclease (RuvC/YqgF family)
MNLPTFPTDYLYKFLAISGLFIFIFSIVFPMTRISELNQKALELDTKAKILEIETEELTKEIARLDKDINIIEKRVKLGNINYKDKPELDKEISELRKKNIEQRQKITLLRIKGVDLEGRNKMIKELHEDFNFMWGLLKIGCLLGVFFS